MIESTANRAVELADELWDLPTYQLKPSLSSPGDLKARHDPINALQAQWNAISSSIAGRHKAAAIDRFQRPPVSPG